MAFILVQHLDPHHASALPELLSNTTAMPVAQVQNPTRLKPDHVYVIPPNTSMMVQDGALTLEVRPESSGGFRPIDVFFKSLAKEFRSNAIGIVLSGTASDGTIGLKTIKAEGGITFAQDQTARFDGMPRSAIAAGVVDFVFPPRRIAEELTAISHRMRGLGRLENEWTAGDGTTLHRVLLLLRKHKGVDFTQYKQATILRRINRRITLRKAENLERYIELLQKEPEEVTALFDDVLINVTDFFRDPDIFETAKKMAFPSILRDRQPPSRVRIWVPGCSSGEEVYSIAIALMEFLESEDLDTAIQIFGTDVSDAAIARARLGIYDQSAVENVSPERLQRFFQRTEAGYQINRIIRERCVFSRHNVAKDPPLSRMDLISCRNLLIYFSPTLQHRVISTFAYALRPSGCLVLGPSETLGSLADYFLTLDESHKIYCRKTNALQGDLHFSEAAEDHSPQPLTPFSNLRYAATPDPRKRLQKRIDQLVLSQYGPAGVVVNEGLRIIEYRGDMEPYVVGFRTAEDTDLLNVIREELRAPLSTAIEQARRTNVAVVAERIPLTGSALVAIAVVPIPSGQHFLILFGQSRLEVRLESGGENSPVEIMAATAPLDQQNEQLQQELASTREYLQAVIQDLRSANEEAQSANEELQSTNEELQTAKEELQSSNEELNTVNAEMQSRNAELGRLNDDLLNLLASMHMPIIMTGSDLRIRRFTPMAERVLRLIPTDVGRPISDLMPRINVPKLQDILQQVLDTLQPYEQETQDQEGRVYLMRVRPYRTMDNRIDGVVLQLLDVSELKRSLEEVKHARDYAESIVNTVREPLVVLDQNFAIQHANQAFYDTLNVPPSLTQDHSIFEVARRQFDLPSVRAILQQSDGDIEIEQSERGETRIMSVTTRRLRGPEQKQLILMAFEDITERKRSAEARYRRLFESARDGIVLTDAKTGEIMDINPCTEKLLGYSRNELVRRKLWEIQATQKVPQLRAALHQIRDQRVLRFDDMILRTKDGLDFHAEVIANIYTEGDRQAIQFNIRDVSERKKFERELQETQKLESLGLLAGGIAHDFNNLLTGILGNASLAYAELPPESPMRVLLREVVQASERAAFLTRQMLAYAGKGHFVKETFDLGNLVQEISALVRTSIPKTVELTLDLAPNLPPIEADPSQIQQVVMNLVINGAEAIREDAPGKVKIRTFLREIDTHDETTELFQSEQLMAGTYVQLEVSDTGLGMDEATKARIFDPFFTTKFTGRGLGLAAVQGIVKAHGGAIRVYSTPGHGTTFLILLPAQRRSTATIRPGVGSHLKTGKKRPTPIPPGSVALVIDDEETVRSLAINALSRVGMKVLTAENGKTGVEMFREHQSVVSVVVLDLKMPVMGGEEALAELKQLSTEVPVILSSGFRESELAGKFPEPLLRGFLQKPYTSERLVSVVTAALRPKA